MKRAGLFYLLIVSFVLSGCVTRTYQVKKDRVDQDLISGNHGYLMGKAPASMENKERRLTRQTQVVEIELGLPVKLGKKSKKTKEVKSEEIVVQQAEEISGNKGYVTSETIAVVEEGFENYTVQKNDTLQKISQKLYGTTKKWMKIYDMNKDVLSAPDKIYPGQVIKVPVKEAVIMKETKENLK